MVTLAVLVWGDAVSLEFGTNDGVYINQIHVLQCSFQYKYFFRCTVVSSL